jgi:hypothetical protein
VYTIIALESDKKMIEAIINKVVLKTFDYDGEKYTSGEAKN